MAKQKTTPNAKGQVKLREKALADGSKSLYLDINMNGKRHKEYLKLYLTNHILCQFDLKFILFYISYSAKYDYCGLQLSMLRLESFIKKYNIRYETHHNTIIFHTFAAQSAETALLITQSNYIITLIMAKIGYIMATAHYEKLEADRGWMQEYGCVKVIEENDAD